MLHSTDCHHCHHSCLRLKTKSFSGSTEWLISSLSPAWIMGLDMWSTSTWLALVDVLGSQVEVVEVVYHYITMPSRVQHAMITSLQFSPPRGSQQTHNTMSIKCILPPVSRCAGKKRRKPDDRPFPEEDYKVFPRENLYDRIILPGKLYNLDHFTAFSEEGISFT